MYDTGRSTNAIMHTVRTHLNLVIVRVQDARAWGPLRTLCQTLHSRLEGLEALQLPEVGV